MLNKNSLKSKFKITHTFIALILDSSLKNKEKTWSPPWKHIACGKCEHRICPTFWKFSVPSKKKVSVSVFLGSKSSTFDLPSTMWWVQSRVTMTARGLLLHMANMFKSGILLIVAPSSIQLSPNTLAFSFTTLLLLSYFAWKLLSSKPPDSLLAKMDVHARPEVKSYLQFSSY